MTCRPNAVAVALAAALALAGHPAVAAVADGASRRLEASAGSGKVVQVPGPAANVFVADPKVAEVRPVSPTALFLYGVAPGTTTVAVLDAAGHPLGQFEVTVTPSAFGAAQAEANIRRAMPSSAISAVATPSGIALSGKAATAEEADRAMQIARGYAGPGQSIDDRMQVMASVTVGLRVRIAEVDRQVTRELGVNWTAMGNVGRFAISAATTNGLSTAAGGLADLAGTYTGRSLTLNNVIDALAQDNLTRLLAEPNLTARSGEAANFLVGGEYPVPVSQQNSAVSVDYKQYGVALSFVPTVLTSGRISLHVRPEVSQLTSAGAVQLAVGNSTIQIPALTVRRAETTVELGSGDSFAIAGLLQDNVTHDVQAVPGLGEIPILGALFRSDSFQHNKTELVIVVTPYVVGSSSDPSALSLPTDGYVPPSDLERMLLLRREARPVAAAAGPGDGPIPGAAGFVVR